MSVSGWDLAAAVAMAVSTSAYVLGAWRLWTSAGAGHGLRWPHVLAFVCGQAALVVALLSPLDTLSDVLFSAHMGQHELLMLVAAPLLMMGKPWLAVSWALPTRLRHAGWSMARRPRVRRVWRSLSAPVVILIAHALALWVWHIPALFEGALRHEGVHAFQHACFFVTAAIFWWALAAGRHGRAGYGTAALFVFLTGMHSGILGALITFAGQLWYPLYEGRTRAAGTDPLADQQLAGVLMWIPAGVILLVLGLGFLAAWLGESERRLRRAARPTIPLPPPRSFDPGKRLDAPRAPS